MVDYDTWDGKNVANRRNALSRATGDRAAKHRGANGLRESPDSGKVASLIEAVDDQNLPSARELINSVQSHLREHVAEKLEGADKFLVRVAINSLSIADRELAYRGQAERAEQVGLSALLTDTSNTDKPLAADAADMEDKADTLADLRWRLVKALRERKSLNANILEEHLRQTVAHRLCIDQPKYSALID